MASTLSLLKEALLCVRNRDEAVCLVSASLVGTQTAQTVEALRLSVEHEALLAGIQADVVSSSNHLSTALLPLLAGSRQQAQNCVDAQLQALSDKVDDVRQVYASLQLFAGHNMALSEELKSSGNNDMAHQKSSLAKLEVDMGKMLAGISGSATVSSRAKRSSGSGSGSAAGGRLGGDPPEVAVHSEPPAASTAQPRTAASSATAHGVADENTNGNQQGTGKRMDAATKCSRDSDVPVRVAGASSAAAQPRQPQEQRHPSQQPHPPTSSSSSSSSSSSPPPPPLPPGGITRARSVDGVEGCQERRTCDDTSAFPSPAEPAGIHGGNLSEQKGGGGSGGGGGGGSDDAALTTPVSSQTMMSSGTVGGITSTKAEFGTNTTSDSKQAGGGPGGVDGGGGGGSSSSLRSEEHKHSLSKSQ